MVLFASLLFALAAVLGQASVWLFGPPASPRAGLSRGLAVALPSVLAASWVMMSAVESRSLAALGLVPANAVPDSVRGTLIGCVLMLCALGLLAATGTLSWEPIGAPASNRLVTIGNLALILGLAAFLEEVLFRGYAFQVVAEARGPASAVGLSAVLFAGAHAANPGVGALALVNTGLAGILLGIVYWRTFSIWVVTGLHTAWNGVMSLAADLPVSGLDLGAPGFRATLSGPEIWTGGVYGPEGGLALTLVTLLGIAWAGRAPSLRRSPAVLAHHPLPGMRMT